MFHLSSLNLLIISSVPSSMFLHDDDDEYDDGDNNNEETNDNRSQYLLKTYDHRNEKGRAPMLLKADVTNNVISTS